MNPLDKALEHFIAGRLDDARRACRKALQARPGLVAGHLLMAEIQRALGDAPRAAEALGRAVRLHPGWSEAHAHLASGDLLADCRQLDAAQAAYRRALAVAPGLADARFNLAAVLHAAGRADESIAELRALLERDPQAGDARRQLVLALQDARRFEEMAALCAAGDARDPFYAFKRGVAQWWLGAHTEALASWDAAEALTSDKNSDEYADLRLHQAFGLLALGHHAEGWDAYRWRPSRLRMRREQPAIAADPAVVAGASRPLRIRVLAEQGLGDELFFLRWAPALRARGHRLGFVRDAKLARLIGEEPGDDAPDVTLCSGDLPRASGEALPPAVRLAPDAERVAAMRARLAAFGPAPYIGVTWAAGILADERRAGAERTLSKHVPPAELGSALRALDARVVLLQRRPDPRATAEFRAALGRDALDLSAVNDDLAEALAALSSMDEYVGVSNTNMHLRAGLPGRGARVLVPMPPEWRWGFAAASPWFPGFSLYRQGPDIGWGKAFRDLAGDLAAARAKAH